MQKIGKILRAVSEKTAFPTNQLTNQPTNQPIITSNIITKNQLLHGWRQSKKRAPNTTLMRFLIKENAE